MTEEESHGISITIFGFTLAVVVVSLVGLLFPALIVGQIYDLALQIDPFELGLWAIPFLTVNLILLGFGISYYKKILPDVILRLTKFVLGFEISRRIATIVLLTLFGIYIGFTVSELSEYEGDILGDFVHIEKAVEEFPFNQYRGNVSIVYVQNFFLWISHNILNNIRILPFVASISLLLLTYFFTLQLTKKRFAGIIAVIILMQSSTFLTYDTTATYSNFWILFYLLSLYVIIQRRWYFSHVIYILALFSKPLTVLFLPMTMFFAYNAKIPSKRKKIILIPYGVMIAGIIAAPFVGVPLVQNIHSFDYATFWMGFSILSVELRNDGFVLLFLFPLIVALFLKSRSGFKQADSILLLIIGTLLSHPLLVAFTFHNILPYRYIPFIIFFAIGVATLFSKRVTQSV